MTSADCKVQTIYVPTDGEHCYTSDDYDSLEETICEDYLGGDFDASKEQIQREIEKRYMIEKAITVTIS